MKKLTKLISLVAFLLLISGCANKNLLEPKKPKIDNALEVVDFNSIKSISDINSIAFEWRNVNDSRITGYNFYRANMTKDGTKLKLINTVKNKYASHYTDKDLQANTKYVYRISCATNSDIESRATNDYVVSTLPLLEGVSFIQAISNLPRQIKIIWRPHSNTRIKSYEVQRKTPQNSKWKNLKTLKGRLQAEYIDTDLDDNVVYDYRIIGKTFDGLETKPSASVKAQTKPLPDGVLDLNATKDLPRKIVLSWQASQPSDISRYNIYRSDYSNDRFHKIKSVDSQVLTFEDFINEDAKIYFYKVRAVDEDGLESNENVNSVMGITLDKLKKPIITLAQIQGTKAILNWQAGDKRAVLYIVRKTIKNGLFNSKTIKFEGIHTLRFEDKDIVRGVEYSYTIQAVDENGILSKITDEAQLILPKLAKVK